MNDYLKQTTVFIISILVICVSGCSTFKKKKSQTALMETTIINDIAKVKKGDHRKREEAIKNVTIKLDKLVKEATQTSKLASEFLASDLFLKATDASLRGDYQLAAFLYKYISILQPEDDYIKRKHAVELIRSSELIQALKIIDDLYEKSDRKDEIIGLILGGVYVALGNKKKAVEIYKEVLNVHPKSEEGCIFLAKLYAMDKEYDKVNNLMAKCERHDRKNAIYSHFKGKIAIERGFKKRAEKFFKRSLKIDPLFFESILALGLLYEEKEEYNKAFNLYEKYLKKEPDNNTILSRVVQILFIKGDFKKVIPYAERLSSLEPDNLNLKVRLGILYTDAKRYEDAKGIFREILVVVPNSDKVLYYLGSLCQQTDNIEEAISYFSKIDSSSSLFHDSILQISQLLNMKAMRPGASDENIKKFINFININSEKFKDLRFDLLTTLVSFHEAKNEYYKAIQILLSLKKDKKYSELHDYYLASLYEKNRESKKARKIILQMLKKNPKNAHALNFIGYSLLESGEDIHKAYEYIKKAIDLKPDDGYIRDSLGWYYYKTGDLKRALIEIRKAQKLEKNDPVINKHLAIIYQDMRRYHLAKKYFEEALKNCKIESEREDVLKAMKGLEKIRLPASKSNKEKKEQK